MDSNFLNELLSIPKEPGVYQFFDKNDVIIYVGKAKSLKSRVNSYFAKNVENAKTRILVKKIIRFEIIVVDNEMDALLLENSLIKKHQPKYNIQLKDDKTYPYICIKKEPFPRVFLTRRWVKDGSEYFGPYASVKTANVLLGLIRNLYPLRTCKLDLSSEKIQDGVHTVCLEYHIKNCLGPCEAYQSSEEYDANIELIRKLVKGNFSDIVKKMKTQMVELSANLEFEQAQAIKEKLEHLQNYQARSTVVNPKIHNICVFSIISDSDIAFINAMRISNGAIIQSNTIEVKKQLDETDSEILTHAILEYKERWGHLSPQILTSEGLDTPIDGITHHVPKLGDKRKLIDLSLKNAKYYRLDRLKNLKTVDPERHQKRIMEQLQKDLRLPKLPEHIECFDNSNIQGTNPVAACVVFKKAKPSKKDYRKFHIKTVVGPDDFASMEEVVGRRYKRLLEEKQPLPQLIVIDGGKGQLSSAYKALNELNLTNTISIVGIAKRLEEIYFPGDSIPLYLDKTSESLKLIQHMRNEAHRFGINFHRDLRSKNAIGTELENIDGIGEKTALMLLKKYKSVEKIKNLPIDTLIDDVGKSRAQKIMFHLNA